MIYVYPHRTRLLHTILLRRKNANRLHEEKNFNITLRKLLTLVVIFPTFSLLCAMFVSQPHRRTRCDMVWLLNEYNRNLKRHFWHCVKKRKKEKTDEIINFVPMSTGIFYPRGDDLPSVKD